MSTKAALHLTLMVAFAPLLSGCLCTRAINQQCQKRTSDTFKPAAVYLQEGQERENSSFVLAGTRRNHFHHEQTPFPAYLIIPRERLISMLRDPELKSLRENTRMAAMEVELWLQASELCEQGNAFKPITNQSGPDTFAFGPELQPTPANKELVRSNLDISSKVLRQRTKELRDFETSFKQRAETQSDLSLKEIASLRFDLSAPPKTKRELPAHCEKVADLPKNDIELEIKEHHPQAAWAVLLPFAVVADVATLPFQYLFILTRLGHGC